MIANPNCLHSPPDARHLKRSMTLKEWHWTRRGLSTKLNLGGPCDVQVKRPLKHQMQNRHGLDAKGLPRQRKCKGKG